MTFIKTEHGWRRLWSLDPIQRPPFPAHREERNADDTAWRDEQRDKLLALREAWERDTK